MTLSVPELEFYTRQTRLPEIGPAGQARLKAARVLVVGVGGLGCPALEYLARAGVGYLGIVDGDAVATTNLHRQTLYTTEDIGQSKAITAVKRLKLINPHINLNAYSEFLSVENGLNLISQYDIVLDGSDNFGTRYLVNDACVILKKAFIGASIFRYQGQVSVYNIELSNGQRSGTYRCLFPEPPNSVDAPACTEAGVLGVLPGIMGLLQATEALKIILNLGDVLSNQLLIFDALNLSLKKISYSRQPDSSDQTALKSGETYQSMCADSVQSIPEISVQELKSWLDASTDFQLVDVRESHEREEFNIGGDFIPMDSLPARISEISRSKPVVFYCRSGVRSAHIVNELQSKCGYTNLLNLKGGVLEWTRMIDSALPALEKIRTQI